MTEPLDKTLTDEICRRLVEGESLRSICLSGDMPGRSTVLRWLTLHEDFRADYTTARRLQADALADEILDISDTPALGVKTVTKADGTVELVEGDMIEHRRLRVDSRKWLASKLAPKKYGEATLLKHADPDGNKLELDDAERSVRIASILSALSQRHPQGDR